MKESINLVNNESLCSICFNNTQKNIFKLCDKCIQKKNQVIRFYFEYLRTYTNNLYPNILILLVVKISITKI